MDRELLGLQEQVDRFAYECFAVDRATRSVGVAIHDGRPCFRVTRLREGSGAVIASAPDSHGIPIEVIDYDDDPIPLHRHLLPERQQHRVLRCGLEIGNAGLAAHRHTTSTIEGSLGCFVTLNDDGRRALLSCQHVLAIDNLGQRGDPVVQPSSASAAVAELHAFVHLKATFPPQWQPQWAANVVDAAVAAIPDDRHCRQEYLSGRQLPKPNGVGNVALQSQVHMVGCASGPMDGVVIEVNTIVQVKFPLLGTCYFREAFVVTGTNPAIPFAVPGDSGAAVIDKHGGVVGLVFGGQMGSATTPNRAYVCPIGPALYELGCKLLPPTP